MHEPAEHPPPEPVPDLSQRDRPLVGSLFAGIGGFDLGFERAGFSTAWQVELDPLLREVLALRFPHAQQWADVRECGSECLRLQGFPWDWMRPITRRLERPATRCACL